MRLLLQLGIVVCRFVKRGPGAIVGLALLLACGVGLASWYRDLPVTEPQTPETLALEYVDLIFTGRYAEAEEYAKVESRTCSRGDCFLDPSFATPIEYPQLVELCLLYTSSLCVGGCGVDGRCAVVSQQSRMQFPVIVSGKMRSGSRFPNNLARNSLACLSNIEIQSLELQRLWRLLKYQANELRAKFPGLGRGVVAQRDVSPRWMSKKCARDEGNYTSRALRF